ncbi:unnamed protein product [Camellia sinensis]
MRSLPTLASISASPPFSLSVFKSQSSHSQGRVSDCESRHCASIGSPKARVSTTTATFIIISFLKFYIDAAVFSFSLCFEPPWELSAKPSSVQTCRTLIILSGEATDQTTVVIRASNAQNLTLFFGCSQIPVLQLGSSGQFNCSVNGIDDRNFYLTRSTLFSKSTISCFSSVIVPVFQSAAQALEGNSSSSTSLKAALYGGFGLQWSANSDLCSQCVTSGGQCGYESGSSSFTCFCADKAYASSCSATQNGSTKGLQIWLKIGIGTNRMCSFLLELAIFIETAMFLSFQTTPMLFC